MSDIPILNTTSALVMIMTIMYAPGLLFGLVFGAFAWRRHRVFGALLGALASVGVSFEFWNVYDYTSLSVSMSPAEVIAAALARAWPGLILGVAAGAWLWRSRRVFGAVCGALIGFALWLGGWLLLNVT
jgi:hypothetical protein